MTGQGSPLIANHELQLVECIPEDLGFLETYRHRAYNQILWDGSSGTVRGKPARDYMIDGVLEEIAEVVEVDRVEPDYSRFDAMLLVGGNAASVTETATPTAVNRHLKEFGDVSWYLFNCLTLHGLDSTRLIPSGILAIALDKASQPRSNEDFSSDVERLFPFIRYFNACHELAVAVEAIRGIPRDERIIYEQKLIVAAGRWIVTTMHMAKTRFSSTYESILDNNLKKLDQRIANATVFDKSGGDDR